MTEDSEGFVYESPAEERMREEEQQLRDELIADKRAKNAYSTANVLRQKVDALLAAFEHGELSEFEGEEIQSTILDVAELVGKLVEAFPPDSAPVNAFELLDESKEMLRARHQQYGEMDTGMREVAGLWSMMLGQTVRPYQVPLCMAALKVSLTWHSVALAWLVRSPTSRKAGAMADKFTPPPVLKGHPWSKRGNPSGRSYEEWFVQFGDLDAILYHDVDRESETFDMWGAEVGGENIGELGQGEDKDCAKIVDFVRERVLLTGRVIQWAAGMKPLRQQQAKGANHG